MQWDHGPSAKFNILFENQVLEAREDPVITPQTWPYPDTIVSQLKNGLPKDDVIDFLQDFDLGSNTALVVRSD